MINVFTRYSLAVVFLSISCDAHEQSQSHDRSMENVYASDDGSAVLAVIGGKLYMGALADGERYAQIPQVIGTQGPLVDRSNSEVRCVVTNQITFAVPRSPRLGQHFECNGLQFSIVGCGRDGSCETFEAIARCARFRGGRCLPEEGTLDEAALAYRLRGSTRTGIAEINFDPATEAHRLTLKEGTGILSSGG